MLLQQASSPGPSGAHSPKPAPSPKPHPHPSPSFNTRFTGSPNLSDGASSSNSPRLGASPKFGSPRLGSGSPKPCRGSADDEAALEKLQAELKEGWTVHTGRDGRLYYCNHITRTASWLPPAESWPSGASAACGARAEAEEPAEGEDLPYGWEQALDSRGKPYYINHVNKTTTYVAPEGCGCESPPAPRDVVLQRDPDLGFGFVAGSEKPVLVRFVTDNSPSVGKLEPGDQILCVNGEDVRLAAREHVISAVRACSERVTLRVCQPARTGSAARRSALLSAAKRARLRAKPPRVRFADSVQLNGAPMYPPSAFSLGDLCLPPMANVLKVFLENGQTKSFKYDATTTVADVVASLKDKLCITATEHFSLVVEHVKSLRRNKLTLLDPKESLARIAARPGSHKMRCLYRVVFVPSSAGELARRDLAALDYLYVQCCNDVLQERFAPELQPEVALRLAALHVHQHALANNLSPAKLTVKTVEREFGLERFVPAGLLEGMRRRELRRLLAHALKLNAHMTGPQRQLTQLQAKLHYLDIVGGLPSYGAKCFSCARPERVLLVSPRFGLSQILGNNNAVPQSIASLEEVECVRVRREGGGGGGGGGVADVAVFLRRDRVLALLMDERDAAEMPLVIAGYYRLATGKELNVELEREPITEDIAPPYLSQHKVVPAKWSYLHHDSTAEVARKHFAIFSMPPPYHATPETSKTNLDTNMNTSIANRNHSNTSSPLIGYDSKAGLLGHDVHFEKCRRNEDFRLFDPNDACYLEDGMGFDLQSVLSLELLENAVNNPRLVEAKNEEVLRRVEEMQKLVENSEQYLTENSDDFHENGYNDGVLSDEIGGRETCVDQPESDTESNASRMSTADDAPGILKHSDSLLLLTETINQGLSGLTVAEPEKDVSNDLTTRQSQGLSAILNNCGLTDALLALNNDVSQSESDNDSLYTPTNSPIRKHLNKPVNKAVRTSFGLHSPDATLDNKEPNLKEYLKQLREKSSKEDSAGAEFPFYYQESLVDNDAELIDLTLIPPPQTPDELDSATQVPQILPVVPPSFADDKESADETAPKNELEEFIANVTVQPPTVKITPAIELTPEEIMSYIIPPPPASNSSTLDRESTYVNQTQGSHDKTDQVPTNDVKPSNGDVVRGTLSVSEIRNMFAAKTLSEARNSLLLKDKSKTQNLAKTDSPKGKRKSIIGEKQANGVAHIIEYPTVERKGMFSCCSKDKSKNDDSSEEADKVDGHVENSDTMPDVCEIRPPPRRKSTELKKAPERPPKTAPTPAPRPRSNSFTCSNNELSAVEIPNHQFSTLNNRKLNYKVVCDINEQHIQHPPQVPPRIDNKVLAPPPPLLLPPKKPPLPPVPSIEVLRMKTSQKLSPVRNPEQRLASIGSPHFHRNLSTYRNLETESRLTDDESTIRSSQNYSSLTLQSRHVRSNSETKSTILKNKEMSTALSLCSPQMNRRFSNRPDILNGAPGSEHKVFSPPLSERKSFRLDTASPTPKTQNHVRFKEDIVDDIPTPPSPPSVKFPEFPAGNNGHVSLENLLCKTEAAVDGLLQRLHQAAQKCSHQHSHGGGEDIDEVKFQRARSELTMCAVSLVGTSRTLVGALGGGAGAAQALADCLAPLRRLADLAQALGRHTSSPLQTRNLVLRVHDVTAAFKDLAGAEMAQIIHEHNAKSQGQGQETSSTLEGQLALRAECLANVLATLLRSLRVFSP
ncbi:PREDICTED: uncharacterized protein LOC106103999 [Papilio polytes]|uniref:uncharacterized protein LOC106103999 n=1 Tax=Papilio polytes TaxID=76194 RepID=UPI000676249D|nr:PREDICTED: uncharacterized protein LOC106103999 [Papilio polytes]